MYTTRTNTFLSDYKIDARYADVTESYIAQGEHPDALDYWDAPEIEHGLKVLRRLLELRKPTVERIEFKTIHVLSDVRVHQMQEAVLRLNGYVIEMPVRGTVIAKARKAARLYAIEADLVAVDNVAALARR